MNPTPWTRTPPTAPGWYIASTDRDASFRRYWHGTHWSAPVHVDDMQLHGERARAALGESQAPEVEWCELPSAAVGGDGHALHRCGTPARGARAGRSAGASRQRAHARHAAPQPVNGALH